MKAFPVVTRIAAALAISAAAAAPASAFTTADANTLMNAYNGAFYSVSNGNGYFKLNTTTTARTDFWKQAEEIEMVIDAYERTGNAIYLGMITELCNGFSGYYGTSWSSNTFNDDIMWAAMAYTRAYQKTGNTTFRTIAKNNFDMCYTRAWDTAGGGGMWWTTAKTSKNSCVNFPASIAAHLLYQALGDASYLTKSQAIFDWGKANLWNPATGQVWDSTGNQTPTTYNQGTFVGAANFLGDVANATLAANYTMNSMGSINAAYPGYRMMPTYPADGDGAGFNGIGYRWIAKFMGDRNLQSTYLGWLRANANRAWDIRRTSDNLSWCRLHEPTPTGTMWSFGCSSSVTALQVVPADTVSNGTYALFARHSGKALNAQGGATANGTDLIQYAYSGSNNFRWTLTGLGSGQYKLVGVNSGKTVEVEASNTANDAIVQLWTDTGASNQKFTLTGNHGAYYSLIFVHSGKAMTVQGAATGDSAKVIQYTYNGGKNAQWQFRNP